MQDDPQSYTVSYLVCFHLIFITHSVNPLNSRQKHCELDFLMLTYMNLVEFGRLKQPNKVKLVKLE